MITNVQTNVYKHVCIALPCLFLPFLLAFGSLHLINTIIMLLVFILCLKSSTFFIIPTINLNSFNSKTCLFNSNKIKIKCLSKYYQLVDNFIA